MRDILNSIFSSYKRTAGILFITALLLILPITIDQLNRRQETRSRAEGTFSVSLSQMPEVEVGETFITYATMNTEGNLITSIDLTLTYTSDTLEMIGLYHPPAGFTTTENTTVSGSAHYTGNADSPISGDNIDIGFAEFRLKAAGNRQIQLTAWVNILPPTATPTPPPSSTLTPTPAVTDVPSPTLSVTPVCTVQCIAPPEGCSYENNTECTCGDLVCPACTFKTQGDANCDTEVDTDDFNIWRDEFLNLSTYKRSDFNSSGIINTDDFNIWRDGFLNPNIAH
jgi:hypothetical protein